ncbi:MAG: hypothetical protein RSB72_02230 [Bacilli bacterium]
MKRFLGPIILAVITGFVMAQLVFSQYEKPQLQTVFGENEKVNIIQLGVYSSKENMQINTKDFAHYIYNKNNGMYYVYVGMTNENKNVIKLKEYYKQLGKDIYIKQINISNEKFLNILKQYDELLLKTEDKQTIKTIQSKVLKKYEELVK